MVVGHCRNILSILDNLRAKPTQRLFGKLALVRVFAPLLVRKT